MNDRPINRLASRDLFPSRAAYTLVELIITMSVGSTLLVMAAGLLHQSLSLASAAAARGADAQSHTALADQFRRDAHLATDCVIEPAGTLKFVLFDQSQVTYTAADGVVNRDQPLDEDRHRHETFALGLRTTAEFALTDQQEAAVLTIRRSPAVHAPARVDRHVVAVVGRRIQHEQAEVSR